MQNDAVKLPISSEPVATRPMLRSHPIEVDPYQDLFEPAPPRPAPGALAALRPASRLLQLRMPTDVPRMDADRVARLRSLLRPGDILLTTDNAFPLLQAATYLTLGSNYTHSLVYEGDGKVLEVSVGGLGGEGVIRTSLEDRIGKRMLVEAIRPPYRSEKDRNAMVAFCRARIGAPYDYTFNLDNNRAYYCTELLYKALAAIPNPIQVPFVRVAGRVIAGLEDFKRVPGARVIYSDRSNFWKNAAHRYPVAVG
ncbi:MAG: hypothetical protein FJX76_25650, partial [Armatimonadetes bacterium]|nr:hypothetical protein [Armatimonadota bacterium]